MELSRAPVAKQRPLGAQEQAQMMRVCAFITLPTSLNGASPPSPAPHVSNKCKSYVNSKSVFILEAKAIACGQVMSVKTGIGSSITFVSVK